MFTLLAFLALAAAPFAALGPVAHASGIIIAENSPEATLANLIFRILDIPVTVYEISELRTTRNMGRGEIALAYSLANASGYPVSHILHLRFDEKMGWGKIAKTLGVKLHGPADKSMAILREGNLDQDADDLHIKIRVDLDDDDKPGKAVSGDDKPAKNHGKHK